MIPDEVVMQEVESSQVKAIGHDPKTNKLYVQFIRGESLYSYENVTTEEFEELKNAESVGKHLNAHIKPSHAFERLV